MVSFLDFEGTDPVSAAREAADAITAARTDVERRGVKSFLFASASAEEFDQRAEFSEVPDILDEIADKYLGSPDQRAKLTATLRREFVATSDTYGRPLDCPWCGAEHETWEQREYHINSEHPTAGKPGLGDETNARCELCGEPLNALVRVHHHNDPETGEVARDLGSSDSKCQLCGEPLNGLVRVHYHNDPETGVVAAFQVMGPNVRTYVHPKAGCSADGQEQVVDADQTALGAGPVCPRCQVRFSVKPEDKTGSTNAHKQASDACGGCPAGTKCVCTHDGCRCVKTAAPETASFDLAGDIANMAHGDHRKYASNGAEFGVSYHERQAHGDNGEPDIGNTVGEFTIYHPSGRTEEIHKSPETGGGSKRWAAEQVARRMTDHWTRNRMSGSVKTAWNGRCDFCGDDFNDSESDNYGEEEKECVMPGCGNRSVHEGHGNEVALNPDDPDYKTFICDSHWNYGGKAKGFNEGGKGVSLTPDARRVLGLSSLRPPRPKKGSNKSASSYATADVDFVSDHDNEEDIRSELENKPVHDRAHHPDGVEVTSVEPRPGGGSYGQAQLQYVTEHNNQDDEEEELRNHPDYDGAEVSYFERRSSKTAQAVEPKAYAVCPTCRGKGTHVNPSIDAHGLTAEDFDDDPDFAEDYMRGAYDVRCAECGGNRVVPQCSHEGCTEPAENEIQSAYSGDHRDRATKNHWDTCYQHATPEAKADRDDYYQGIAENEAELRMGA